MVDIVDRATRSRMMAGIRGKNTKPELIVRRYLHGLGYRYRLHRRDFPGRPDLVMPKYKLAVFVHGCFWHRHQGCFYAALPSTRKEFWQEKLEGNVRRDALQVQQLTDNGWRVLVVWECGLKLNLPHLNELLPLIGSQLKFCEWPVAPLRSKG